MRDKSEKNEGEGLLSKQNRGSERNKSCEDCDNSFYKGVWTTSVLFPTYHPVCCEPPLDEACDDIGGVVAVVGDAGQARVDGDHD